MEKISRIATTIEETQTSLPDSPERRQALKAAAGVGLLLLLPMFSGQANAAGGWTAIGKAKDFPLNQPVRVPAGGAVLFVTRRNAKTLAAVSAKCTHRGCEVGWNAAQSQLVCPCHGAAFAANGANIHGTRRSPDEKLPALPAVPVRQKAGRVEVNLAALAASAVQP